MDEFPTIEAPTEKRVFQILRPAQRTFSAAPAPSFSEKPSQSQASNAAADKRKVRQGSYQSLGLSPPICAALYAAGYNFPTPIQRKVIPPVLSGDDVVAMARTGSGKTAAFLAPLLHRLSENPQPMSTSSRRNGPRALVVAPTRELVLQEIKFCNLYAKRLERSVRSAIVVGGTPLDAQFEALAVCPDIIFATPGRLLQILAEMGAKGGLTLATTETLVFDEADRLFEGTLAVETAALIDKLRDRQTEALHDRQTILVSATMPHALAEFSRTGLRKSLSVIRLDAEKSMSPTLAVSFLSTRADVEKDASMQVILRRVCDEERSAIVFAATHRRVEYLTDLIRTNVSESVGCVHGVMDQLARQETVARFRKSRLAILVVTDVAARGIDLPELDVVINYDMPATPKLFIHRVGRVGRAGRFGTAVSLVAADELPFMLDLFLFLGQGVKFAEFPPARADTENTFSSNSYCMESTFVFGVLPKAVVDEEVERTRNVLDNVELDKAHTSAKNAHSLYLKTRGTASGESVRRAKALLTSADGGRKAMYVHPWFVDMESSMEREATEQVTLVSTWRPKESAVAAPSSLVKRKEAKKAAMANERESALAGNELDQIMKERNDWMSAEANDLTGGNDIGMKAMKMSVRQSAMEDERRQFFLPTRQDANQRQAVKALKVKSGGAMGDDFGAFRELRDAAMDVNADSNVDLLRAKHVAGSSQGKYWDRVSKKYIKGGVTDTTSKRNLHVATREAKARAKGGASYGTEDGTLFKKWLSKNRKAVEEFAERVEDGANGEGRGGSRFEGGMGSNDFRRGAFGRKSRVAAAARSKSEAAGNVGNAARPELKTVEEIKKSRKIQAKAEARRLAHKKGKSSKKQHTYKPPQRGASKSRVIVRRK